jgi:hypothetical protein
MNPQMEALLAAFFLPPTESEAEYEIILRNVAAEMEEPA